ncbi:uncharacterized protein LOC106013909, partial [Aplysia californica]|uniref:Uncharacterized protein LOC106013909 n=1 Tax=Aplysia californica TaxID=6500 RepID=A0ABM1AEM8_APLCA
MEYISWSNAMVSLLVFLIAADLTVVQSRWQTEWMPNFVSREPAAQSPSAQVFEGLTSEDDGFKLLLVEDDKAFVGAKNRVYYMSLQDTRNISTLVWEEDEVSRQTC